MKMLNFLAGLLSGAAVGAVIVLLYTPMPGEDVREQIRLRFEEAQQEAERAAREQRARLERELERMKRS
ncbi:MAG: hypothetical protein C4309_02025 [Chloroflexota bacterium]